MNSLGIDLGGTKTALGLVNSQGQILKQSTFPTAAGPFSAYYEVLVSQIRQFLNKNDFTSIGVGCAGQIEQHTGKIFFSPNLGWKNAELGACLRRDFDCQVTVDNDVRASTVGEYLFGKHGDPKVYINVFLGTGIGSGIIIDGKILRGASNSAGEIGHTTLNMHGPKFPSGNHGVYEYYASGSALARLGQDWFKASGCSSTHPIAQMFGQIPSHQVTGRMIGELAKANHPEAMQIVRRVGEAAGAGLVNVVNLLNPDLITYGGGLSDLGPMLLRPMLATLAERAIPSALRALKIVPAALGNEAAIIGAAHLHRMDSRGNIRK